MGGGGWLGKGVVVTTEKWRNKKGQIGDLKVSVGMRVHVRRVTPGKGELKRTRVCVRAAVRSPHHPLPLPYSAEEMNLCHLALLMAV